MQNVVLGGSGSVRGGVGDNRAEDSIGSGGVLRAIGGDGDERNFSMFLGSVESDRATLKTADMLGSP